MNQVCIGANWAVLVSYIHGSELVVIVSIKPATTAQSLSLKLAPISQLCKPRFDLHSNLADISNKPTAPNLAGPPV